MSIAAAAFLLTSGVALADNAAPAAKPVAPTASTAAPAKDKKVATVEKSEKSKKCSAEADAKNLHGKERKAFRKTCLKAA